MAIDLSCFTRRAWHGHVNEQRHEPERAAPTALKNLARVIRARQPKSIVIAGEGKDLFRAKLFPMYKAKRPPKPPELLAMEDAVRLAFSSMGIHPYCVRGLEADDVLHGAALLGRAIGVPVVIVAEDKDAEALVSDEHGVIVWDGQDRVKDEAFVRDRWDVPPVQLPELFAIAGDPGDGFPGVDGWGPKTAAQILQGANKRLPELLREGGFWWVPSKWREKWLANRETIQLSYKLALLRGEWLLKQPRFQAHPCNAMDLAAGLLDAAEDLSR